MGESEKYRRFYEAYENAGPAGMRDTGVTAAPVCSMDFFMNEKEVHEGDIHIAAGEIKNSGFAVKNGSVFIDGTLNGDCAVSAGQ